MEVCWKIVGVTLFTLKGMVCETCLVYNYGTYTHKDCDSCCGAGILRRCCDEAPTQNKNSQLSVGIVFGCLLGLMFLAGLCGAIGKYCNKITFRISSTIHQPMSSRTSPSTRLPADSGDITVLPKPPPYSAWSPPPAYALYESQIPPTPQGHSSSSKACDMTRHYGAEPPPYSPAMTQTHTIESSIQGSAIPPSYQHNSDVHSPVQCTEHRASIEPNQTDPHVLIQHGGVNQCESSIESNTFPVSTQAQDLSYFACTEESVPAPSTHVVSTTSSPETPPMPSSTLQEFAAL